MRPAIGRQLERSASDPRWRRLGDLLTQPADLAHAYQMFRGVFTHAEARVLVERYAGAVGCPPCDGLEAAVRLPIRRRATPSAASSLARYMRNQLLRDGDTMSMAWGLELRVPFLDGPLVDTLSAIPARRPAAAREEAAAPGGAGDSRSGSSTQPKRGFMFPFQRWLDDEWREMFAEIERDCPVPTETWYRKWCCVRVHALDWSKLKRSAHE